MWFGAYKFRALGLGLKVSRNELGFTIHELASFVFIRLQSVMYPATFQKLYCCDCMYFSALGGLQTLCVCHVPTKTVQLTV